jgi:hypothetical protein
MTLGVHLFGTSMALIVLAQRDWKSLRKSAFHTYGGAVMGAFMSIAFALSVFARTSNHENMNKVGIIHSLFGHVVLCLGVALIFHSTGVPFARTPCSMNWISGLWAFSYCVVYIVLTVSE